MKKYIILLLSFYFFSWHSIFAATLSLLPEYKDQEKEIRIFVTIDPENVAINACSGHISFDKKKLFLENIDTSNSFITTWVTMPEKDNSLLGDDDINFEGIVSGGFDGVLSPGSNKKESGKLFTLVFSAVEAGDVSVSLSDMHCYVADGKATEVIIQDKNIIITTKDAFVKNSNLLGSFSVKRIFNENNDDIYVEKISSPDIYNGRDFIIFENSNKQKSLVYFEVSESSSGNPKEIPYFSWTKAKSPYLLTQSGLTKYVHVRATYSDGTYSYTTLQTVEKINENESLSYILMIATLLVLAISYAIYLEKNKK